MSAPKTITPSALSRGALEALVERLLAENTALQQAIDELRAEVAQLKGVKGRPKLKPSGMEKGPGPEPTGNDGRRGAGGRKSDRLTIAEDRIVAATPDPGSGAAPACHPSPPRALADP